MIKLKDLYEEQIWHERYNVAKKLFMGHVCKGSSVEKPVIEMIGCIYRLIELGMDMYGELTMHLMLPFLLDSHGQFIMNSNIMKRTLGELQSMLKGAEPEMNKKAKENVLLIEGPKAHKGKPKRKKARKQKEKSSSIVLSGGVQKN